LVFLHRLLMVGSGAHQAGKSKEELASAKAEQARLSEEADAARRDAKDLRSQLSEALGGGNSLRGELDALNLKVVFPLKKTELNKAAAARMSRLTLTEISWIFCGFVSGKTQTAEVQRRLEESTKASASKDKLIEEGEEREKAREREAAEAAARYINP
jgi:hypothetical protein